MGCASSSTRSNFEYTVREEWRCEFQITLGLNDNDISNLLKIYLNIPSDSRKIRAGDMVKYLSPRNVLLSKVTKASGLRMDDALDFKQFVYIIWNMLTTGLNIGKFESIIISMYITNHTYAQDCFYVRYMALTVVIWMRTGYFSLQLICILPHF